MKLRGLSLVGALFAAVLCGCGGGGGGASAFVPGGGGIAGGGGNAGGGGGAGGGTILGQVANPGGLAQSKLQRPVNFANLRVLVQDTSLSAPVGPDGAFRLDNVPPGLQVVQIDDATGAVGGTVVVSVGAGRTTSTGAIAPQPVGRITGSVFQVTAEGQLRPLAEARVEALPLDAATETVRAAANGRPRFIGRSDPTGEYNIRGVLPGSYLLTARAPGFIEATQTVEVAERQTVAADFALDPQPREAGTLRATVRTALEGQTIPLREVLVALHRDRPTPPPGGGGGDAPPPPPEDFTITQINGQLPPVPPGANAPGLRTHRPPTVGPEPPVPSPRDRPLFGLTGGDGTVELHAVPTGRYQAFFLKEGFAVETRPVEIRTGETSSVEVTLRANTGRITGTVTDARTRRPIASAGVLVLREDSFIVPLGRPGGGDGNHPNGGSGIVGGGQAPAAPNARGLALLPPERFFALTDNQGRFELTVEQGAHTVVAFAENYREAMQNVTVQVGQSLTVNLQLEQAAGGEVTPLGTLGRNLNQRRRS